MEESSGPSDLIPMHERGVKSALDSQFQPASPREANIGGHRPPYPCPHSPLMYQKAGCLVSERPAGTPAATRARKGRGVKSALDSPFSVLVCGRRISAATGRPYPYMHSSLTCQKAGCLVSERPAGTPAATRARKWHGVKSALDSPFSVRVCGWRNPGATCRPSYCLETPPAILEFLAEGPGPLGLVPTCILRLRGLDTPRCNTDA